MRRIIHRVKNVKSDSTLCGRLDTYSLSLALRRCGHGNRNGTKQFRNWKTTVHGKFRNLHTYVPTCPCSK